MPGPANQGQPDGPAAEPAGGTGPGRPAEAAAGAGTVPQAGPAAPQPGAGAAAQGGPAAQFAAAPQPGAGPARQPGAAAAGHAPGSSGIRAVIAALGANLGIAAVKLIAFTVTGSASMLAESVHSIADSGNQVLLLVGRSRSRRARTEEHPFGFGRERYFYAFVVAVVLFTIGAVFSCYEGIHKIIHPQPVHDPAVAFAVLGIAVVLESLSLRTALRETAQARAGYGWLAFIRRAKAPELPAILLEDTAALAGLLLATAGVALAVLTGSETWDGLGSLAIGLLLGCVAVILAIETKSLLIGESASAEAERAIVTALEAGPEIQCVIHLRTLHVGPETLLVVAKVSVPPDDPARVIAAGIDAAERRVRAVVPMARMIYLEPDVYAEARADATDPSIRAVRRRPRR